MGSGAPDGKAVFDTHCAMCHLDPPDDTIPRLDALKALSPGEIVSALREGKMLIQGDGMTPAEHVAVAEYLTGQTYHPEVQVSAAAMCRSTRPLPRVTAETAWNGWGRTAANRRFQPDPGITVADLPHLRLKWAYGLADATQARSQPAIHGGRLFFGSQPGLVQSIDAKTGCIYWTFRAEAGVRTAISVGPVTLESGPATAIYFTDARTNAYALNAETGELIWKVKVESHPSGTGTGAPTLYDGRLYVPVTGVSEENAGARPDYECCTFRGSITALDADTGAEIWKTYMLPEPKQRGTSSAGKPLWGPAGVGVWSAPTIDGKRGLLYAATGNAYAGPAAPTSNAIVALDLATGRMVWHNQVLPKDIWIFGCDAGTGGPQAGENPNCPDKVGPDYDFSASPVLVTTAQGKDILVVTQKAGMAYGLDPAHDGRTLWEYRWGSGSGIGGVWGAATDGRLAFLASADQGADTAGGLHAVDLVTGRKAWVAPPQPLLCGAPARGCSAVQSAAVTAIPGVVFSGSQDGGMRAYSAETGEVLWTFDTNRSFETVNGVPATGGSIDGPGPVIADGMLYVTSGNGGFVGRPGNVLLAFEVERD